MTTYTDYDIYKDALLIQGVHLPNVFRRIYDRWRHFRRRADSTGSEGLFMGLWKRECWEAGVNPADALAVIRLLGRMINGRWEASDWDALKFVLETM